MDSPGTDIFAEIAMGTRAYARCSTVRFVSPGLGIVSTHQAVPNFRAFRLTGRSEMRAKCSPQSTDFGEELTLSFDLNRALMDLT
jgi:hypothetical protein